MNRIVLHNGDCHDIAAKVVASLSSRTLALAFVDVLYLFSGGIGIARNLGSFVKRANAPLDDLIPGWRSLKRARLAAGAQLTKDEMAARDQPFVLAFMSRMGMLGYQYAGQGEPYFTNEKNVKMYHLLFFSQHAAGLTLWRNITRVEPSGQRRLPF
jgi:hypothetical protein